MILDLRSCSQKIHIYDELHFLLTLDRTFMPKFASNTTMYILNVAEKNDAAKSIANIMSKGSCTKREGLSKFNKIYEFDFHMFDQNCRMIMTSVSGHMMNYEFSGEYKKWHSCSPLELFNAPLTKSVLQNCIDIQNTIQREIKKCKTLIIWTDCDREGENIGFEIGDLCRTYNGQHLKIYRAKFSEITYQSISRACSNLGVLDQKITEAVDARQEFDLRIGAAFTRFQTMRYQNMFPSLKENLMSYGSCQFPTLGLVVERYKEVQNFIQEPFWKICASYQDLLEQTQDLPPSTEFNWKRVRLFDRDACLALYAMCMENPLARVVDIKSKPKSRWRPQPMDTIAIEKLASRKLRINAKETMNIAEKLYQKGYISYPRTETNIFPKELNLRALVEKQSGDPRWGDFATTIVSEGGPCPRNGHKSDKAHPPIHPIKAETELVDKEKRIYELVTRHFLACCSTDAKAHETTVEIMIGIESFSARGLMILEKNYLEVYWPYETWNNKNIPVFRVGQTFTPSRLEMKEGTTKPPPLLTEPELITLMEKNGIGTDATHADHIETIKSRNYVGCVPLSKAKYQIDAEEGEEQEGDSESEVEQTRSDNRNKNKKLGPKSSLGSVLGFLPGQLGMALVEGYNATGHALAKPKLRSELETDLEAICQGAKDKNSVLQHHLTKYKQAFLEVQVKAHLIDQCLAKYFAPTTTPSESVQNNARPPVGLDNSPVRPCGACGSDMRFKRNKDGTEIFLSCTSYPECKWAIWFPKGAILAAKVEADHCDTCQPINRYNLVTLTFDTNKVPPTFPSEYTTCLGGCDAILFDALHIRIPPQNRSSTIDAPAQPAVGVSTLSSRPQSAHTGAKLGSGSVTSPVQLSTAYQTPRVYNELGEPVIYCLCGKSAQILTTKQGTNAGRKFYKCPEQDGQCTFFQWQDELDYPMQGGDTIENGGFGMGNIKGKGRRKKASFNGGSSSSSRKTNHLSERMGSVDIESDSLPQCKCNQASVRKTVQKEGPNRGRAFYTCKKKMDLQCGFFQWESSDSADTMTRSSSVVSRPEINRGEKLRPAFVPKRRNT